MLPTRADGLALLRQQRQHVLHDQCGADGVQRERAREAGRIELRPVFLRALLRVVQEPRRVDHEPELAVSGGRCGGGLQARLVLQLDGR
jgi:hypothetical protein